MQLNREKDEKKVARGKLLTQISFLDADFRKAAREQAALTMEVRRHRKDKSNLEIMIQEKSAKLKKIEISQSMLGAEIQKLKRRLQLIR